MTKTEYLEQFKLMPCEIQATLRVFKGESLQEIADDLGIKKGTVKNYLTEARRKTNSLTDRNLFWKLEQYD